MSDLAKQLRLAVMDLNLPPYRSTSIPERVAYNDGARDARHAIAEMLLTHPLLNGAAPATGAAPASGCDMEVGPCSCGAWHGSGPFVPKKGAAPADAGED